MLRYCLPLIPATVCDWVIQVSDRYFLSLLLGPAVSGLYAVSAKVATILLMLASIFTSAWQLSIVSDRSRGEQERFFSNVFSVYEAGRWWRGAPLLILAAPLVVDLLAAPGIFRGLAVRPPAGAGGGGVLPGGLLRLGVHGRTAQRGHPPHRPGGGRGPTWWATPCSSPGWGPWGRRGPRWGPIW